MKQKILKHRSAGGLLFFVETPRPLLALVKKEGCWIFPKGRIEKDEPATKAAVRELQEELGINKTYLFLTSKIGSTSYSFQIKNEARINSKKVDYYLFLTSKKLTIKPLVEEGFSSAKWFSPEEAKKRLSFDNDKQILDKAILLAKKYKPYYCCLEDIKRNRALDISIISWFVKCLML